MVTHIFTVKNVLTLFLASFVVLSSIGVFHVGMTMDAEGHMTHCPFMPGVSLCAMSAIEMVVASHSFSNGMFLNEDLALSLLLLSAVALVVFVLFLSPPLTSRRYRLSKKIFRTRYNYLTAFFASGILNPKLY